MPEHLKALVVILMLAAAVFAFAKMPACMVATRSADFDGSKTGHNAFDHAIALRVCDAHRIALNAGLYLHFAFFEQLDEAK